MFRRPPIYTRTDTLCPYKTLFRCPDRVERTTEDCVEIATWLAESGVTFERWRTHAPLAADATDEDVCQAYAADIARLKGLGGYRSVDIARLLPDNPAAPQMRQKFLSEHTHSDDEVRFFVEGSGQRSEEHTSELKSLMRI